MIVRAAGPEDVSQLLRLMHGLAEFEGYRDRFAVTAADLLERGFDPKHEPQFHALVADEEGVLAGYALTYLIPFTFDLRPTMVLKEFFIAETYRGRGIGGQLYSAMLDFGRRMDVRLIRWQVLPDNEPAIRFYRSFGAHIDEEWDNWVLEL